MSRVTNIIIFTSISEDVEFLKSKFNEFKVGDSGFLLTSVEDDKLPDGWYGGSKKLEAEIFIAAYNYFDIELLIQFMQNHVPWEYPESVQIAYKGQDDSKFKLIDIFNAPY